MRYVLLHVSSRSHRILLLKEQGRLYSETVTSHRRQINKWNKLLTDCVNAKSVNRFKNKLTKKLIIDKL